MKSVKEKQKESYAVLKDKFGYKNVMAAPKMVKVVISSATGTGMKKDRNKNEFIVSRLAKITGQKAATRGAKKSVATFKVREGDPIGVMVTLRGARMYGFLDKFFNIALPRTKDFRGIDPKIVDNIGNATLGIKEHTIFPETSDEEIKDVFGIAITLVSTAKNKAEATEFFRMIGVPFKEATEGKKKK
jgi:large subunit ribosomal protein L5